MGCAFLVMFKWAIQFLAQTRQPAGYKWASLRAKFPALFITLINVIL